MTNSQHRLEQAIEAAHAYRKYDLSGDVVRVEQLDRTIDDLVGYWDRRADGTLILRWPLSVEIAAHAGERQDFQAEAIRAGLDMLDELQR